MSSSSSAFSIYWATFITSLSSSAYFFASSVVNFVVALVAPVAATGVPVATGV